MQSSSASTSGTLLSNFPALIFFEADIKLIIGYDNLCANVTARTIVKNNNNETIII